MLLLLFLLYSMDLKLACVSFMTWIDFSPSQRNTLKYYDVEFCLSLQIYQFYINSPMTKDISFLYRVQSGVSLPTSSRDVKILTLTVWLLML
jgi:hypothetical protein